MAALVPFAFEGRSLRAFDLDGESWFVAGDAAAFLGYAEAKDLTRTLDDDEKGRHPVPTPGGEQDVSIISEAGLYRAIVQRRATSAIPAETREAIARFQRWVFHDVLPSIRRTGVYAPAEPANPPAVASTFKGYFSIGRLIGLDRNQSALAANRATVSVLGVNPLALMGATHLLAPAQEHVLTPTEIGRELGGRSGIAANQLLAERGLQIGKRDAKDRAYWQPTEAGMAYARLYDTGKKHGDGTPVTQVKWRSSVLDALRPPTQLSAPAIPAETA
ncbi:BRO-N domain-containing protein [Methylorubrum extorquens]|uniref:Prophage antirepressor n=1 Tax=Methylorubrum extorquens DSM 13060 TaxID=882800 RepID=H1KNQ8_METEX|nr:BRO family protein [Methylorubrum extorquens]EHP90830.1 prophage antirepressor [Methylorubrum extorquens DSM 13060]